MMEQPTPRAFTTPGTMRSAGPSAVTLAADVRVAEHVYLPGRRQDKHAHPHASISVVLAGSLSETVGAKTEDAFPLSVVVKPVGTEHTDRFGTVGARMFSVHLDQALVESLHECDLKLSHWHWVHGGPTVRRMLGLLQASLRPTLRNEDLEDLTYEILASLPSATSTVVGKHLPQWLERVKQELDETFSEGVRVRDLAARANVHPVYLARLFRRYLSCSITDYRTLLKARAAAQLLASGVPLATAAYDCGFADQSHMGRAFKAASGLTPRNYRRLTNTSNRRAA